MKPFKLAGTVKPFSGQGRKLGYPTANIECAPDTPEGTFVGYTTLMNHDLPSIIFIGAPVTLGETYKRAESYILDLEDKDLYGQEILIEVIHKLRDNQKFKSVDELVKQIKLDETLARTWFLKNETST